MSKKNLIEKLIEVQKKLKAPKSQFNRFGNYAYRNQEDILEAVKPLLAEQGLSMTISDNMLAVGSVENGNKQRIYVRATVTVTDGETSIENTAFAREPEEQKGMNEAQITGSASSYARKYALNGMFLIDDTKDADATNDHGKGEPAKTPAKEEKKTDTKTSDKPKEEPKKEPAKSGGFKPKTKPEEKPKQEPQNDEGWE